MREATAKLGVRSRLQSARRNDLAIWALQKGEVLLRKQRQPLQRDHHNRAAESTRFGPARQGTTRRRTEILREIRRAASQLGKGT